MHSPTCINISELSIETLPFPHCYGVNILQSGKDLEVYNWLKDTGAWGLTQADFYEQHEFSFLDVELPPNLSDLTSAQTIEGITTQLKQVFGLRSLSLVDVTAHKLVDGQRIAIHNDFIGDEETHRFVVHLNPGWTAHHGGILMLFGSSNVEDVSKLILPVNNSGFGFEISENSHHAVSEIHEFCRYSIVYTFKAS